MSLITVPFSSQDHYSTLSKWWNHYDFSPPPVHSLPKTGVVIYNSETPICAGFLYKTDSSISWMEFIVANPKSDKRLRSEALDVLINCLTYVAKENGFKIIFTSSDLPKLIERKQKHGFIVGDQNVTQLVRIV